jgi:hypothetical protein
MRNLYRLLGVPSDATQADIKKAYRKLARELHPDVNSDATAAERFKAITEAFEVLSDPDKRKAYNADYGHLFGDTVLDDVETWFGRFIAVPDLNDLALMALWTAHTFLAEELYTTPRLQLDSTMPGSGKTTVLDHLSRLCHHPIQIASPPSQALIPRMLERGMRTLLLDEVDRILRPDGPATPDLLAIINSGYRVGARRPVLIPATGGGWAVREMPTYSPVAMAGNAPVLPDDTKSRSIRVLLMPDDGTVEDSDWELIEDEAEGLQARIEAFADGARDDVKGMHVDLPDGCIGRAREKWRPLKRVAVAAGGRWPDVADALIARGMAEDAAEREAGLKNLPPGMRLLTDLHAVWPKDFGGDPEHFASTKDLVGRVIKHNADYWGQGSPYGKQLTETRFGLLLAQAAKLTSRRPGGVGPRGFVWIELVPVWNRLHIPPGEPGEAGEAGEPCRNNRIRRANQLNRVHQDPPPGFSPPCGPDRCDGCGWHIETQGHMPGCARQQTSNGKTEGAP